MHTTLGKLSELVVEMVAADALSAADAVDTSGKVSTKMRAAHAEYEAAGGGGGVEEQRVLEREAR